MLKWIQIYYDNGAMKLVVIDYPYMYWQGCCMHILDLFMEDWGKEDFIKGLVFKAKTVVKYIQAHHLPIIPYKRCVHGNLVQQTRWPTIPYTSL